MIAHIRSGDICPDGAYSVDAVVDVDKNRRVRQGGIPRPSTNHPAIGVFVHPLVRRNLACKNRPTDLRVFIEYVGRDSAAPVPQALILL